MTRKQVSILAFSLIATAGVLTVAKAIAQTTNLPITPLGFGMSMDKRVRLTAQGPNNVMAALMTMPPGSELGWHTHPGPGIIIVNKGTLALYDGSCVETYPAGSVFYELPGHVHRAVNTSTETGEVHVTFILPAGVTDPIIPVPEPRSGPCTPHKD